MRRFLFCIITVVVLSSAGGASAYAQRVAVSTNLPTYALMGTINVGVDFAVGQHSSIGAKVKFCPFSFQRDGERVYLHDVLPSLDYTYWFWNYYSGWYVSAKALYGAYNTANIRDFNAQGALFGAGVAFGYGWMLSKHLNLSIGLGAIGGWTWYARYPDDTFNRPSGTGHRFFFAPDDPTLSLNWVF